MQSRFLFLPYQLSLPIGIIDVENRIIEIVNFGHVTELGKKCFLILSRA